MQPARLHEVRWRTTRGPFMLGERGGNAAVRDREPAHCMRRDCLSSRVWRLLRNRHPRDERGRGSAGVSGARLLTVWEGESVEREVVDDGVAV